MARYIAFLRAINVGGHRVTMDKLSELFRGFGFLNVETFIASGNVIFESKSKVERAVEKKVEDLLEATLGYEVGTFVRTDAEVRAVSAYQPFDQPNLKTAQAVSVGFLSEPLSASGMEALSKLTTETDEFHVHGREIYWLIRTRQSDSKITNRLLERAIGCPVTFRNVTTIAKLAAKYPD